MGSSFLEYQINHMLNFKTSLYSRDLKVTLNFYLLIYLFLKVVKLSWSVVGEKELISVFTFSASIVVLREWQHFSGNSYFKIVCFMQGNIFRLLHTVISYHTRESYHNSWSIAFIHFLKNMTSKRSPHKNELCPQITQWCNDQVSYLALSHSLIVSKHCSPSTAGCAPPLTD